MIALYKGLFLPSDTDAAWTVSRREMLKNRMLGAIATAGRHEEKAGRWEGAAGYYLRGLEVDALAESFYQRLLVCYGKLGRLADAAQVYNRCCMQLQRRLGVKPSAETKSLYTATLRKS